MNYETPSDATGALPHDAYLTTKEAAKRVSYSHRTFENWRRHKVGPPWETLPSGGIRYRRDKLDAWAARARDLPSSQLTWEVLRDRERKAKRAARDKERQKAIRLAKKKTDQ